MNKLNKIKKEAKLRIGNGSTKEAIVYLENDLNEGVRMDELILIRASLITLERSKIKGEINNDEFSDKKNIINVRLIDFIDIINDEDINVDKLTDQKDQNRVELKKTNKIKITTQEESLLNTIKKRWLLLLCVSVLFLFLGLSISKLKVDAKDQQLKSLSEKNKELINSVQYFQKLPSLSKIDSLSGVLISLNDTLANYKNKIESIRSEKNGLKEENSRIKIEKNQQTEKLQSTEEKLRNKEEEIVSLDSIIQSSTIPPFNKCHECKNITAVLYYNENKRNDPQVDSIRRTIYNAGFKACIIYEIQIIPGG